jgi:L-asparaginase
MQPVEIALFTTGGTIDGADSDRGTSRQESDAAKWLETQSNITLFADALFNKDSRQITDADRTLMVARIRDCDSRLVLVTHGTFTIAESARAVQRSLGNTSKTVLLVGAWKPFGAIESDAPLQMEFALKALCSAPCGVWIAMDGRLWHPEVTQKIEVEPGVFKLREVLR